MGMCSGYTSPQVPKDTRTYPQEKFGICGCSQVFQYFFACLHNRGGPHNPEVVGSNPSPATMLKLVNQPGKPYSGSNPLLPTKKQITFVFKGKSDLFVYSSAEGRYPTMGICLFHGYVISFSLPAYRRMSLLIDQLPFQHSLYGTVNTPFS